MRNAPRDDERCIATRAPLQDGSLARCMLKATHGRYCWRHKDLAIDPIIAADGPVTAPQPAIDTVRGSGSGRPLPWPTHPNGIAKTIGEMTDEERDQLIPPTERQT